uniref:Small ribosomal subunit protein mS40 n=1 Tax=Crassostrea virginica TaxID=6565 RepID=A0A8B8D881_CRAVI|nr:uncharacterized protein LOC111125126 [Crassostrea virginica]
MLKIFQKVCFQPLSLDSKVLRVTSSRSMSMRLEWTNQEEDNTDMLDQVYGGFGYKKKHRPPVSVEESIDYFSSAAFRKAYGTDKVWKNYKRNYKGNITPKPRYTCMHKGIFLTNNPCPVCRDIYFVVHHTHVQLLKQFLDTNTIQIADNMKTGVCRKQQRNLVRAAEQAIEEGYLEGPVLFKTYDMDYYRSLLDKKEEEKTDVPFRLLNPELLPYNIMKKNNRERREEFERKLQEDMETMKI